MAKRKGSNRQDKLIIKPVPNNRYGTHNCLLCGEKFQQSKSVAFAALTYTNTIDLKGWICPECIFEDKESLGLVLIPDKKLLHERILKHVKQLRGYASILELDVKEDRIELPSDTDISEVQAIVEAIGFRPHDDDIPF